MEILVRDLSELESAAQNLLNVTTDRRVLIFKGPMGVGKTTLIKYLCRLLGVTEEVSSPTYSIVNEYYSPNGNLFHFDLFRIRDITEALDIGFHEYLASDQYCFIEWPEIVSELLPPDSVSIYIEEQRDQSRLIRAELPAR